MKFGIYSSIANPPRGEHLDRCIDEVIAEAQLAEASGFDACFFGEHHQDKDGFLPSPLIVATAVAAQTRRLQVGTSVMLLPLHHPVHVAEDVITLDFVSKGRVILGVGIGYQAADFQAFAVPMEHRVALFEEGVEIIRRCWSGEPFSFHGAHYHLDNIHIRPRPYPDAHPAAVDRRQRPGCGAPGRTPRRCLCRHPQHRPGEHHTPGQRLSAGRPAGWATTPGGADAGCLGGRDRRGGRGSVWTGGDDGLSAITGRTAWPSSATSARKWSLRWRTSPPIASSSATPRRACANSIAGMRPRAPTMCSCGCAMPTPADRRTPKSCRRSSSSENACCPSVAEQAHHSSSSPRTINAPYSRGWNIAAGM